MAETSFGVLYDGPALDSGEIAVNDLAPALLALGGLFTETSVLMYPNRPPVSLNIKATEDGSFWVFLHLMAQGWEDILDIYTSKPQDALANLTTNVFLLFGFIKWVRGRKVEPATTPPKVPEPGMVRIEAPDGTTIDVPSEVWLLYMRQSARRKAREVIAPLERDGIDRLEFRPRRKAPPELVVTDDDAAFFDLPEEPEDALTDNERVTLVEIVQLGYESNKKWRLREGAASFSAPISDDKFWEKVHRREIHFAEGDMLRIRLRVIQTLRADGKLTAEHRVLEVLDIVLPEELQQS
jgi:hypothetical protein